MPQLDFTPLVGTIWSALLWLIPALALTAALKALPPRLRGRAGEAAVARALRRRCAETVDDVILPDGRGGLTQIDHLALTPQGILVVETKTYRGTVLGRAEEPTWTQVIGRQRNRFQNPLRQNIAHRKAVEALEPAVAVRTLVVFAGDARFPSGLPAGVCTLAGLDRALAPLLGGEVPRELLAAWQRLLRAVRTEPDARTAHLDGLHARFGGPRPRRWPAVVVAATAAAWLAVLGLWHWPRLAPDAAPAVREAAHADTAQPRLALPAPPPDRAVLPPSTGTPPAPVASHPVAPQLPSAAPRRHPPVATIEWADPAAHDAPCALARIAALIERTPASQSARDTACANAGAGGRSPSATR